MLIPLAALLLVGAGVGYAAWEELGASAVEANAELLESVPVFPGARERARRSETASRSSRTA